MNTGQKPGKNAKSGGGGEFVGLLDIGDDSRSLPYRMRRDRAQTDGPVAAPGASGHADDLELHVSAERMAGERVSDSGPDLFEGSRRFFSDRFKFHHASPLHPGRRAAETVNRPGQDCWSAMVNGALIRDRARSGIPPEEVPAPRQARGASLVHRRLL